MRVVKTENGKIDGFEIPEPDTVKGEVVGGDSVTLALAFHSEDLKIGLAVSKQTAFEIFCRLGAALGAEGEIHHLDASPSHDEAVEFNGEGKFRSLNLV